MTFLTKKLVRKIFLAANVVHVISLIGVFLALQNLHAVEEPAKTYSQKKTSLLSSPQETHSSETPSLETPPFSSQFENEHLTLSIKQYSKPSSTEENKKNLENEISLITRFKFSLKKNFHVNATEVKNSAFIPTRANLTGKGITNLWTQASSAEEKVYFGQMLDVYEEGEHYITIYSSFSSQEIEQTFTFSYQPCTDKLCYPPKNLSFTQVLKKENLLVADKSFATPSIEIDSSKKWPLLLAFFLAFLGGIILNFMPCVFPILSLKIFSLVKLLQSEKDLSSESNSSSVRETSFYYFLGVFLIFLILASLVALPNKETVWGFQFQYPLYLATMAIICWILGLEIGQTITFSNYLARLFQPMTKWFNWFNQKENHLKHIFSGGFFVLMSTPCIAPFLGTAILYAFGRSLVEIYTVFLGISLGFSLPFILISFGFSSKYLQNIMPAPGAWMKKLKMWLSLPMFITSLWLFSLLLDNGEAVPLNQTTSSLAFIKNHLTAPILVFILIATLVVPMIYRFKKKLPTHSADLSQKKISNHSLGFFFLLGISMIVFLLSTIEEKDKKVLTWNTLDQQSIDNLSKREEIVFVHVTAEWCITCRINEFKVLEKIETKNLLDQYNVTLLRGDLTSKNEVVDRYMQQLGFIGIPLDIIYPKENNRKPIVLPTFFSQKELEQAIIKAQ